MKLVIGLGNTGEKYEKTRHNLGFMAIEQFFKDQSLAKKTVWDDAKKYKGDIATIEYQPKRGPSEKILLLKPKTLMNNSGMAVKLAADFYRIKPDDIWVLHDDLDLQLGALRIRQGGSSAGHKGIDSIMRELGTEQFWRFRLGIGHPKQHTSEKSQKIIVHDVDSFVLGEFGHGEAGKVRELIKLTAKALKEAIEHDLLSAMNLYNTR